MTDHKCRMCNRRPAARRGAMNRTPLDRLPAINAGVCRPCYENYLDAKMFLAHGVRDADDRAVFQSVVDIFNDKTV